jgi:hypothetical protein
MIEMCRGTPSPETLSPQRQPRPVNRAPAGSHVPASAPGTARDLTPGEDASRAPGRRRAASSAWPRRRTALSA